MCLGAASPLQALVDFSQAGEAFQRLTVGRGRLVLEERIAHLIIKRAGLSVEHRHHRMIRIGGITQRASSILACSISGGSIADPRSKMGGYLLGSLQPLQRRHKPSQGLRAGSVGWSSGYGRRFERISSRRAACSIRAKPGSSVRLRPRRFSIEGAAWPGSWRNVVSSGWSRAATACVHPL